MPDGIRKFFLPWTASDCFDGEGPFHDWLRRRARGFGDLRSAFLVLAAFCLLGGYFLDRRPIMLATIAPLAVVVLLTLAIGRIEAALEDHTASVPNEKE